jgi:diaminopimelate decarboxylase
MKKYERPLIKLINPSMPNKGGADLYQHSIADIEGTPVSKLIKEYGSPLFVISEKAIRNNVKQELQAFGTRYPKIKLAWSYKTNYIDAICRIFHQEGSLAEVVSGWEYAKACHNGVKGSNIIFNGPNKNADDLRRAIIDGCLINIDNTDEIYAIMGMAEEMKRKAIVGIRINMKSGVGNEWDKFGFNLENGEAFAAAKKISKCEWTDLQCLHCHIGTFVQRTSPYAQAAKKMTELALLIHNELNISIKVIDLGGGFASCNTLKASYLSGADTCPDINDYAKSICEELYKAPFEEKDRPSLILETGRALIDNAAMLLCTVIANKRSPQGRRYTIIDAGVNTLFTAFWYNHKISPVQEYSPFYEDTTLFGPLCMNIDIIRESVNLPLLEKGDNLVIHNVGAYNMTQNMRFINLLPAVVLTDINGNIHQIRKRENIADFDNMDTVPSYLKNEEI